MIGVFKIVAVLALLGALATGIMGLAALAEATQMAGRGQRVASAQSEALAMLMLSAAGPLALLALGAAGFGSLLDRLDLLRDTLRQAMQSRGSAPQHHESRAPMVAAAGPAEMPRDARAEELARLTRVFSGSTDAATARRAAAIAMQAQDEGRSLPFDEAIRQAKA